MKTEAGLDYDGFMPTVMRIDGFRIVIWPDDHVPAHVHVYRAGGEVVIFLEQVRIRERKGMSIRDSSLARDVVAAIRKTLLNQWRQWIDDQR